MTRSPTTRLQTYRKKRDFRQTAEPKGSLRPKQGAGDATFMVHKHDATRLHYDLRLEMDGALASWAIPKGPSYDPNVKRLAVQTEDHPLEYGGFEGRIPDEAYGGGDSLIWENGTFDTDPPGQASAQRKKGHLKIQLFGQKLHGSWHLIRTSGQGEKSQWLFFKSKDAYADPSNDVVVNCPESVKSGRRMTRGPVKRLRKSNLTAPALLQKVWPPMLAKLADPQRASSGNYLFEIKYDGFRAWLQSLGGIWIFGLEMAWNFKRVFQM